MELYSKSYNKFIDLAEEGNFSIEAQNQFQDLENYTVCNSFDLQIVNNEVNAKVSMDNSQVLLFHNGSPLLTGRLVYQGSTPDTIKVVYQALPYGTAFKNFIFRDKLKDYFKNSDMYLGRLKCSWLLQNIFMKTSDVYLTIPSKRPMYEGGPDTTMGLWVMNNTNYEADSDRSPRNNHRLSMSVQKKSNPWGSDKTYDYKPWLAKINLWEMLSCMGIDCEYDEWNTQDYFYFPLKVKYEKKFKVTMYRKFSELAGISIWGGKTHYVHYSANDTSEIDEWDEENQCWLQDSKTIDTDGPVNFIGAFNKTIRKGKAVKDMEIVEVLQKFNNGLSSLQIDSQILNNDLLYNVKEGQTYEEDEDFQPMIVCDEDELNQCPFSIDVVVKVTIDANMQTYQKNKDWMQDIPFNTLDFEFMDISTNDFLNMLSLNGSRYTWLRNPMYLTIDNHTMVWNKEGGQRQYSFLTDADIISMEKEVDTDSPSYLRVTMPGYDKSSTLKYLNDLGNDEKKITPTIVSYCYQNTADTSSDYLFSCPPVWYDSDKDVGEQFLEDEIEGLIGYEIEGNVYTYFKEKFKYKCYNFLSDSTDLDYVDYYQDHSEKYKVKCVGYKLTEDIQINGVKFSVSSWKTSDWITWELELYKIKD